MREATLRPWEVSAAPPLPSARSGRAGLVLAVLAAAALSFCAFAVEPAAPYGTLDTPWWTPEAWIVGAVVGAAFVLAGSSAWLVVRQRRELDVLVHWMMPAFYVQLVLTALWTVALFGLDGPIPAVSLAVVLVAFVGLNLLRFSLLSPAAWKLMLPVLLAALLLLAFSLVLFVLNPEAPMFAPPEIALP